MEKRACNQNNVEWSEDICLRCGVCCLCKLTNKDGIFLTMVCCDNLDTTTRTCKDYAGRSCPKMSNHEVFNNGYLPPASCAYAKKHICKNKAKTPEIPWDKVITESEMESRGDALRDHIIPTSWELFKYLEKRINKR